MFAFPHIVSVYAHGVVDGDIVAGPHVRAACRRHLLDLHRTDLQFDEQAATDAIDFFPDMLRLSEGQFEGRPFDLHISQKFIVGSIFGWKRLDGTRRFRRAYIEQGKGNGKSPLAAGIGLLGMFADREPGAQIYAAATSKDQADILFQDAVKMAQANEELNERIVYSGKTKIFNMAVLGHPQRGSFFRPVARTVGKSGSGPRPHMALIDELHEHPTGKVIEMLERGFKFRRQPLLFMITNSGSDRKSVCWQERENAIKAANGDTARDDTFSYVCAIDRGEDPLRDRGCWVKANPLLGTILTEEYLEGIVSQAATIPAKQNNILRLHFCQWTDAETAWITREAWESIEDPTLSEDDFIGLPVRLGLDLASRKDMCGLAKVYPDGEVLDDKTGKILPKFAAFVHGYTPKETLMARAEIDQAPYDVWVREGYLTATAGPVVRFPFIIRDIVEVQDLCDLQAVCYDRHLITRFEEDMAEAGADFPLVEHPQGWNRRQDNPLWMPDSVNTTEDLILEGRLRVHVNPALRAAVAGATFLESPAGLRRFDKASATQRIDLLIALVQAVGSWHMEEDEGPGESVYEVIARQRAEVQGGQGRTAMDGNERQRTVTSLPPGAPAANVERRPTGWPDDEDDHDWY